MYGLSTNFCCCSIIKTPPIFDRYIVPNIDGIIYFFSALVKAEKGASFSNFDQLKSMLTLLLYILIPPVIKDNTSVMAVSL